MHLWRVSIGSNMDGNNSDGLDLPNPNDASQPDWFNFLEAKIKGTENQVSVTGVPVPAAIKLTKGHRSPACV